MTVVYRHETKFCCRYDEIDHVYQWVHGSSCGLRKHYPDRHINNIYFDWFNLQDASDNLIGLGKREKLRLRWYGKQNGHVQMQLERKIKRDKLGTKSILQLDKFSVAGMSRTALRERIVARKQSDLVLKNDLRLRNPVVRNRYLREYFQDSTGKLRMTVDRRQSFYAVDRVNDILSGNRIDYPIIVVELKYSENDLPLVRSLMNNFPLRPVRHSKYLAGLARLVEQPYF